MGLRRALLTPLVAVLACFAPAAGQTPVDEGYRDYFFGSDGTDTPTGEKPECKLWWNDGSWWGSLWNDAVDDYHIYRLNLASHTWIDTGTTLDTRTSKADVLWDQASQKLYVTSHKFTTNAVPTSSSWGQLFRYSYSISTKTYTQDSGYPVDITRGSAEDLTLAKDSTGRLWATWVEASKVLVNHSLSDDRTWGTPYQLPVPNNASLVTSDDISAIIAFGGSQVGIMWSNQVTATTYFSVHEDGDPDNVWTLEDVQPGCSGNCSDDHMSLKADQSGRVFAAIKTSLTDSDDPLVQLVVRAVNGTWSMYTFGLERDHHTRPILLLDEGNQELYIFATHPEDGGAIYYKSSPMNNVQFPSGVGTPFIVSPLDVKTNNATSTKQTCTHSSGILVLASDQNNDVYLHNHLSLAQPPIAPQISSFSPTSGPVGTAVTISGTDFMGATSVTFNGTTATFTVVSETQINTSVPSGATTGLIRVTTPWGTDASPSNFTVTLPPTISSFSPTSGPPGTAVTINGTNFTGATAVKFNTTSATSFTVVSATQISATVPSGASTGKISVTTPAGTATSSGTFTVTAPPSPPTISSFSPTSGPVGTAVTINGSNFTGATAVRFNGTAATSFTVVSSSQITTSVPSGATTGTISVTTPGGTATSSGTFTVTTPPSPPAISSFSPTSGPVGTAVTINGSNFTGATAVRFNGVAATSFTVVSSAQITTTVPSGASTGKISVTTPAGTGTSGGTFTVTSPPSPPVISSFSPTSGYVGLAVTINGSSFTGATSVRFNGTAATFTVISGGQINTSVPSGATTGRITVTTPAGTGTSTTDFTVTPPPDPPAITSFSPASGPLGAFVTINGSDFTGATAVRFNGAAAGFTVVSDSEISATVPSGATTGLISVTTPFGTGSSSTDFTVAAAGPPSITSFSPAGGSPGAFVTINGANLSGATGVDFNGTPAAFTMLSDAQIRATVPAGAITGRISVTSPLGTATSSSDFFVGPVTITSFSPGSGGAGTAVTILGNRFTGTTRVAFNGVTASSYTVDSDTQITAVVPVTTKGKITVTTPAGTGTSATDFLFIKVPRISSFSPTSGRVGTMVTIKGHDFATTTQVLFNEVPASSFTIRSNGELRAVVPAGATTGRIRVTTLGGTVLSSGTFTVLP